MAGGLFLSVAARAASGRSLSRGGHRLFCARWKLKKTFDGAVVSGYRMGVQPQRITHNETYGVSNYCVKPVVYL